jgi:hypothetical protein
MRAMTCGRTQAGLAIVVYPARAPGKTARPQAYKAAPVGGLTYVRAGGARPRVT